MVEQYAKQVKRRKLAAAPKWEVEKMAQLDV
jgi:hypothetical protein